MKRPGLTIFKNAASNLVRGGAQAAVALALPHFLVHTLDAERFAAWALMLQIAAYASFLDFGIQIAVSRFIAQALELQQYERVRKLIETAFVLLSIAALVALVIIAAVSLFAGSIFHGVPPGLLREFQISTVVLALGAALLLPFSTFTGVLVGMHRNEFPALAIGITRIVGAVAAIVSAHYSPSLVRIALCIAIPNVIGGLFQFAFVRHRLPSAHSLRLSLDREAAIDFLRYCSGLTIWSFGMLLVSGLDVTIVGHFQFEAVGYYAICGTLVTMFASFSGTIMNAFLAPFSAMHARGDAASMRRIVIRSTRAITALGIAVTAIVIAYGEPLLRLWVGSSYARKAYPILVVLVATQAIRLMAGGFSIALMATGRQNKAIGPVLLEAFVNLAASLWAVTHFGAIGVAFGSLAGTLFGTPALILFTVKATESLTVNRADLTLRGMALGGGIGLPLLACALWLTVHPLQPALAACLWIFAVMLTAAAYRFIERSPSSSAA